MKKLLVVLLSLGLIVGLSTGVSAQTTFKLGGGYELFGVYDNNGPLGDPGYSRASLWQRVRFMPTFTIAEGLSFTARMDALEKTWGNTSWKTNTLSAVTVDETSSRKTAATNTDVKAQENIEFERGYVDFKTGIGQFILGYQEAAVWGTKWGDYNITRPRARYQVPLGPVTVIAIWEKAIERDNMGYTPTTKTDADSDIYYIAGVYKQGPVEAGLLYGYALGSTTRLSTTPYRVKIQTVQPYVKATLGPVYVEAEVDYQFGMAVEYEQETATAVNKKKDGLAAYALARYTMGPAYVGAGVGYLSGDNDINATKDKDKTAGVNGKDWNPALIMGNNDSPDPLPGHAANDAPDGIGMGYGSKKEGTITYNLFAGYNVTPKIKVDASFTMAKTVVKFKNGMYLGQVTNKYVPGVANGVEYISDDIGKEFDVTAEYKIFDNLTYMVGAGYMWTGDFFKGTDSTKKIGDDYQLLHKLTMKF